MFDLIGKTVGPYRIIEQVGAGGMATVYKAYQPSMDRYVAVKVLPAHLLNDPDFAKRFQREARAIARLEHAHILPVYDYGEYEGITYIAMRYIKAGTLKDRMSAGRLSLDEINHLISQVGSALDYAHRMGVIHRDVKPGNVLIDEQGDAYLSDFGLARMMESSQQLTGSGVGLGTPAYMSPEQGQGNKIDHRTDIYALGIILYEMLTGRVPYEAETPMAVVLKHIQGDLPLPHNINPNTPEPVERVVLKALTKNPADRYQTAGEMVQALTLVIRQASAEMVREPMSMQTQAVPISAREDVSLVTRIQQVWEQPRGKVALVGGVAVILVMLSLFLSQLGGNVAIVAPVETTATSILAEATPTPVEPTTMVLTPTADLPDSLANLKWEQLYNGAIFQRADVSAIAADPGNPNVVYAATTGGLDLGTGAGIYKSIDGGKTWLASNTGLDHISVSGLFIDPKDTQTIYATTFGAGPYKSSDGGASWKPINAGLSQLTGAWNGVSSLVFDPEDHLRLYHLDPGAGVFRSTDGGETWQFVSQPCQGFISLAIDPRNGDHLFAGAFFANNDPNATCPGGIYESVDGGQNWTSIAQDITDIEKASVWRVMIDSRTPDSLFASLEYSGTDRPSTVIVSTNGGKDWAVLRNAGWRAAIAINPNDSSNVYIAEGSELYRSDDSGRTWTTLRGGFGGNIEALAFSADTLYVGATGVYRTSNGGQSWETSTTGLGSAWLELTFDPSSKVLYAEDNDCALYKSKDNGITWEKLRSSGCGLAFDQANNWLYRADSNTLYRSTDEGRTWTSAGKSPSSGDNYRVYVNPVDGNILYTLHSCCSPGPFIYHSTDGGQTWEPLPTVSDLYHGRIVIADDGLRMYAASYGAVDVSKDGGQSWGAGQATTKNNGNPPALALQPQNSNMALLGTWGSGILKTTNTGETWSTANAGLENLYVNTLAFDLRNPDAVYAGTDGGVFLSQDGGDSWNALNTGLGLNLIIYSIAIDPNDSSRVVAVTPDGVYRLTVIAAPTEISSSQAEQARAFAEPILRAVKDLPPDIQDDFSHQSGWGFNTGPHRDTGRMEIVDNVLRLSVTSGVDTGEVGFATHPKLYFNSFVLSVEANLQGLVEGDGLLQIAWRGGEDGAGVVFWLRSGGDWRIAFCGSCEPSLAYGRQIIDISNPLSITVISRETEYVVILNGAPIAYVNDAGRRPGMPIQLILWVPEGIRNATVEYDNLRVWDISDLQ